jgi:hypothetical protein
MLNKRSLRPIDHQIVPNQMHGFWRIVAFAGRYYTKTGGTDKWLCQCTLCEKVYPVLRTNLLGTDKTGRKLSTKCKKCAQVRVQAQRKAAQAEKEAGPPKTRNSRARSLWYKFKRGGRVWSTWKTLDEFSLWFASQNPPAGSSLLKRNRLFLHGPDNSYFKIPQTKLEQCCVLIATHTRRTLAEVMEWAATVQRQAIYQQAQRIRSRMVIPADPTTTAERPAPPGASIGTFD